MIKIDLIKQTLWLSLDNPSTSNSINYEMIDQLTKAVEKAELDDKVRVVVLTGEGKNFCSGGDLTDMQTKSGMFAGESNELRQRYEQGIQKISRTLEGFSKPLIALVNGAAAGAGCDMACMCDIRIGTEKTKFLENFVKIGLVPGDGGTYFLQRVVGYAKAMEMTLTGRAVQSDEALKIGLLNFVFEENQIKIETQKLADLISSNAPIAIQLSKKAMKVSYQQSLSTILDLLSAYQGIAQRSADHFEALKAIQQKSAPIFSNK